MSSNLSKGVGNNIFILNSLVTSKAVCVFYAYYVFFFSFIVEAGHFWLWEGYFPLRSFGNCLPTRVIGDCNSVWMMLSASVCLLRGWRHLGNRMAGRIGLHCPRSLTAPFASAGSLEACNRESQAHAWPLGWVPPGRRCHGMRHAPQVSSLSAGAIWPQFSRGPWGLGPFSACNQWSLSTPGDQGKGNIIIIISVNIWVFTHV